MTNTETLKAQADRFADRAAHARLRTERNTFLSLEQSCRSLAARQEEDAAAAGGQPTD